MCTAVDCVEGVCALKSGAWRYIKMCKRCHAGWERCGKAQEICLIGSRRCITEVHFGEGMQEVSYNTK